MVEEHWDPTREDLEPLKVTREIPSLQIALGKEAFDTSTPQTRNALESFLNMSTTKNISAGRPRGNKNPKGGRGKTDPKNGPSAAKELGLENKRPKKSRNNRNSLPKDKKPDSPGGVKNENKSSPPKDKKPDAPGTKSEAGGNASPKESGKKISDTAKST